MDQYQGKRAVVVGGSSGIGLATAKALVEGGARVVVTGQTPSSLDAARAELGDRALVLASDAASSTDLGELVDTTRETLGSVDLLFLNAGMTRFTAFAQTTEADFDELFAVNTRAPYFAAQKFAPLIARGGAIVVTTSIANNKGLESLSLYSASKAALRSMTRTMARELLGAGIRVNAVSPGPIDTPILDRTLPEEAARQARAGMTENNPMKRFGTPEEIAKAVLFLAFEATYTTGAELAVDGGASQL